MAEDYWNESRHPWSEERRRERERARLQDLEDYGQADHGRRAGRYGEPNDDTGYRPFGDYGPVYTRGGGYSGEGRPYGSSGRYEDLSPTYRDFEADQRRPRPYYEPDRYTPNPREGRGQEARSWWDRAEDEVSSWFGDEDARRRREWDERRADARHRGRGPKGYKRSDARIAEDINDRLTLDPFIDATEIEVKVKDGEATLSGAVFRREDKRRAEDIAEGVLGVVHVQNNLRPNRDEGFSPATGDVLV